MLPGPQHRPDPPAGALQTQQDTHDKPAPQGLGEAKVPSCQASPRPGGVARLAAADLPGEHRKDLLRRALEPRA